MNSLNYLNYRRELKKKEATKFSEGARSRLQKPSIQVQVLAPQESSSGPVTLILDSFLMGVGFSFLPADLQW